MADNLFTYSHNAVIKVEEVDAIEKAASFTIEVVTPNGRVPRNKKFFVEVGLPRITPLNLVPKNKQKPFRLPVSAILVDRADLAAIAHDTRLVVGHAINVPRRKSRGAGNQLVQLFRFPALGLPMGALKVVMWIRSVHKYFDDNTMGVPAPVPFASRRVMMKHVILDVN